MAQRDTSIRPGELSPSLSVLALALVLALPATVPSAKAQAVGFQPTVGVMPSGAFLNTTPAVSADGRYVRIGVDAQFNQINGFTTIPVPAAVSGGGAGMNGLVGGIGPAVGVGQMGIGGPTTFGYGSGTSGFLGGYGPVYDVGQFSVNTPTTFGYASGMNGLVGTYGTVDGMGQLGVNGPPATSGFSYPDDAIMNGGRIAADPFERATAANANGAAAGLQQGQPQAEAAFGQNPVVRGRAVRVPRQRLVRPIAPRTRRPSVTP